VVHFLIELGAEWVFERILAVAAGGASLNLNLNPDPNLNLNPNRFSVLRSKFQI